MMNLVSHKKSGDKMESKRTKIPVRSADSIPLQVRYDFEEAFLVKYLLAVPLNLLTVRIFIGK